MKPFFMGVHMVGVANKERLAEMHELAASGWTLKQIGKKYSITEAGVSYLFGKWGWPVNRPSVVTKTMLKRDRLDRQSVAQHGVSFDELKRLRNAGVVAAYRQHKANATKRGIGWEFNLSTWLAVWSASGKFADRGNTTGKFVMARFGDMGPYSPSNVEIVTINQNSYDARLNERLRKSRKGFNHDAI